MSEYTIPPCFYRVSIKALIFDETKTKFLIMKEKKGVWDLPGGGLEWGTNPEEDLQREIQEEMGLVVTSVARRPFCFLPWEENGVWRANLVYETTLKDTAFTPSDECIEIRFVTASESIALQGVLPNVILFAKQFEDTVTELAHTSP